MKIRMRKFLREVGLLSVCGLLLAAAGCGCGGLSQKASEIAAEKSIEAAAKAQGQNIKVDLNSSGEGTARITISGEHGSTTVTSAATGENRTEIALEGSGGRQSLRIGDKIAIPDTFPQDIPLPPGLAPTAAIHDQSGNGPEWMIQGTLPGTLGDVRMFYTERLQQARWTPLTSMDTAELLSLTFEKEDRILSVMAGPEGSGIMLSVAVSAR